MTREEIVNGLEIYTVGRSNKAMVHITVEELQKFIDEIKKQDLVIDKIRAEIEHVIDNTYDSTDHDKSLYNGAYKDGLYDALDIIDKYRKGQEDADKEQEE